MPTKEATTHPTKEAATTHLLCHLPHTVHKLQEDRGAVVVGVFVLPVPHPLSELVSKADPLLLYQHLKATDGAIVWIQHQHG